jgi:hypothetical protein
MDLADFNVDKEWLRRANSGETEAMFEVANQLAHEEFEQCLKWLEKAFLSYTDLNYFEFEAHQTRLNLLPPDWLLGLLSIARQKYELGDKKLARRFIQIDSLDLWGYEIWYPEELLFELCISTGNMLASERVGERAFHVFVNYRDWWNKVNEEFEQNSSDENLNQRNYVYSLFLLKSEEAILCLIPNRFDEKLDFDEYIYDVMNENVEIAEKMQDSETVEMNRRRLHEHLSGVLNYFPRGFSQEALFNLVFFSFGENFAGERLVFNAYVEWTMKNMTAISSGYLFNKFALDISEHYLYFGDYLEGIYWYMKSKSTCQRNYEAFKLEFGSRSEVIQEFGKVFLLEPGRPCSCIARNTPCIEFSESFAGPFNRE